MNRYTANRHISSGNPIANALVVIVGVLTIGAFIVLGVVAAVAIGGIVLVMAAVLGIRIWWLGRKLPKQGKPLSQREHSGSSANTVIEGEFQIVSTKQDEKQQD